MIGDAPGACQTGVDLTPRRRLGVEECAQLAGEHEPQAAGSGLAIPHKVGEFSRKILPDVALQDLTPIRRDPD